MKDGRFVGAQGGEQGPLVGGVRVVVVVGGGAGAVVVDVGVLVGVCRVGLGGRWWCGGGGEGGVPEGVRLRGVVSDGVCRKRGGGEIRRGVGEWGGRRALFMIAARML